MTNYNFYNKPVAILNEKVIHKCEPLYKQYQGNANCK